MTTRPDLPDYLYHPYDEWNPWEDDTGDTELTEIMAPQDKEQWTEEAHRAAAARYGKMSAEGSDAASLLPNMPRPLAPPGRRPAEDT